MTFGAATAEDGRVAAEAESDRLPKNGKRYHSFYHWLFYIRDMQILGLNEYCDTLRAFESREDQ
ncbi:hypothetical protein DXT94_29925 [Rhizobium sp. ICMP 5592]|nr:hypothetical protein [Rhizobium sp. ICMP 5592]